jgi:hypothetical protein
MTLEIFQISRPSVLIPLLECPAETGPARYTHKPAPYQCQVHRSTTNQDLRSNSTQKTNLMGQSCLTLYVVLSHHDVGLNLTRMHQQPRPTTAHISTCARSLADHSAPAPNARKLPSVAREPSMRWICPSVEARFHCGRSRPHCSTRSAHLPLPRSRMLGPQPHSAPPAPSWPLTLCAAARFHPTAQRRRRRRPSSDWAVRSTTLPDLARPTLPLLAPTPSHAARRKKLSWLPVRRSLAMVQ